MSYTVGKFTNLPQSKGYVPFTMQELAYAPSILRDRYDKTQEKIGEGLSELEDWTSTANNQEFVQSQIDPLAEKLNKMSQDLASSGFVNNNQLRDIQKAAADWKRMKTKGVVGKAEAQLKQIEEAKNYANKIFEKDPTLAALYNIKPQSMGFDEEGNLVGTGIDAPNLVKHYTKEEQVELTNKALSNIGSIDVKKIDNNVVTIPITSQGDFAALLQNTTISTKEKGRIVKGLLEVLGNDIPQSMAQEIMLRGQAVGMDEEGNDVINTDYKNLMQNNHFEVDKDGYLQIDKPISSYGRLISGQAGIKEESIIKENNRNLTPFGGGSGSDEDDGPRAIIQGSRISTKTISPFANSVLDPSFSKLKLRSIAYNNLYRKYAKDEGYYLHNIKNNNGTTSLSVTSDEQGRTPLTAYQMNSFFDKYNVDNEIESIVNPETNIELQEYISKDHRLIEYKQKHGAAKTLDLINKWYSNLSQSYGSIINVGESKRKSIEELYSKNIHNYAIVDGNNNILTFDVFAKDTLGKSQEESLKDGYSFTGPRNVPGKGVMFEFGFTDSKGKKVTAFVEPTEDVNVPTQMISAEIDNAILSMHETKLPYAKITDANGSPIADTTNYIDGEIVPIYWTVVPNWETGEALMYGVTDPSVNPFHYIDTPDEKDTTKVIIKSLSSIKATENEYANGRIQKVNWK